MSKRAAIKTAMLEKRVQLGWSVDQINKWGLEHPGEKWDEQQPMLYAKYKQHARKKGVIMNVYQLDGENGIFYDVMVDDRHLCTQLIASTFELIPRDETTIHIISNLSNLPPVAIGPPDTGEFVIAGLGTFDNRVDCEKALEEEAIRHLIAGDNGSVMVDGLMKWQIEVQVRLIHGTPDEDTPVPLPIKKL